MLKLNVLFWTGVICAGFYAGAADITGPVCWPYENAVPDPNFEKGAKQTSDSRGWCNFPAEEQETGWYGTSAGWAKRYSTDIAYDPANGSFVGRMENNSAISNRFPAAFSGNYEIRFQYVKAYNWYREQKMTAYVDDMLVFPEWLPTNDGWITKVTTNRLDAGYHIFSIVGKGTPTKRTVFDAVSIRCLDPEPDGLLIAAEPLNYSIASAPYYGIKSGVVSGEEFVYTAPTGEIDIGGGLKTRITGWKIYRYIPAERGFRIERQSTEETKYSCTYRHGEQAGAVVWQWATPYAAATGTTRYWTGLGEDNLASTAANWTNELGEAGAPVAGDAIVLSGNTDAEDPANKAMTYDASAPWSIAAWTQDGYTNTVTFGTVFDIEGFHRLHVSGDILFNTGKWTHPKHGSRSIREFLINVVADGNMTIGADATVDVMGCGYNYNYTAESESVGSNNRGSSYGGYGASNDKTDSPFGRYYAPFDIAGGGTGGADGAGGGCFRLETKGKLIHNGVVNADAPRNNWGHYAGAGGAIWITAAEIEGRGTLRSRTANIDKSGSGGRIAVILTGANKDFANYDILNLADASSLRTGTSAPGTIYAETAADTPREGWYIVKGNGSDPGQFAMPFSKDVVSCHFSKITITNNIALTVESGKTLDLRGTEVVTTDTGSNNRNYIYVKGGTLITPSDVFNQTFYIKTPSGWTPNSTTWNVSAPLGRYWNLTVPASYTGDLNIGSGLTMICDKKFSVSGDITMTGSSKFTISNYSTSPWPLELDVGGDMTIAADAIIDLRAKGYDAKCGPVANGESMGGSHGGQGLRRTGADAISVPFGDICNPVTAGAGGSSSQRGGGILKLVVAGDLVNNGRIAATAADAQSYDCAAGGSVNITCARLSGSGLIDACARKDVGGYTGWGGGGRIAVKLTGAGATFSDYETSGGKFTAYGSRQNTNKNAYAGGAGTVYLQSGTEVSGEGTLIIDGRNANNNNAVTPLGGDITSLAFGTVIITNGANVILADNARLTVSKHWYKSDDSTFTAGPGSTVEFVGDGDTVFEGNTTFANFACSTAGKTLKFAEGATVAVTETFNITGESTSCVTLQPAVADTVWNLDTTAGGAIISEAAIGGCQSAAEVQVLGGENLGDNTNVVFINVSRGETMTWTGSESSQWADPNNWTSVHDGSRTPVATDNIEIPAGCVNYPVLGIDAAVASISIANGASFDVGTSTLAVYGNATLAGAVSATTGGFVFNGNVNWSGTFEYGNSTVTFAGTTAQNFTTLIEKYYNVTVLCPSLTVNGDLDSVSTLSISDGSAAVSVTFGNGKNIKATQFIVNGTAENGVTLASSGKWNLNASKSVVSYATVSGSDASKGVAVVPTSSTDGGNNVNWFFVDTRTHYTGGDWPVTDETTDLVIDANGTLTSEMTVKSITVSPNATMTITGAGSLDVAGSVTLENDSTLVWDTPGTIGGNLVMLDGSVLTHSVNGAAQTKMVDLVIEGDGYVSSAAEINVNAKGLNTASSAYGAPTMSNGGTSHGGKGIPNNEAVASPCFGSVFNPTNVSSRNDWGAHNGAGAVKLFFRGSFTLDGDISACPDPGADNYEPAGGSVNITCAELFGKGSICADGTETQTGGFSGGGGRIAIRLTAQNQLAPYSGEVTCYGGYNINTKIANGAPGTYYLETASDAKDCGTLYIQSKKNAYGNAQGCTELPSTKMNTESDRLYRGVKLEVHDYGKASLLRDLAVRDIDLTGGYLYLNGHTLTVRRPRPRTWPKVGLPANVIAGGTEDSPGKVLWQSSLKLILR